jgi:hypothetical protein
MIELKPVIYDDHPNKLAEFSHNRQGAGSVNYSFGEGTARLAFKKNNFWQPDAEFFFFRTVLNPVALDLLKEIKRLSGLGSFRDMHLRVLAELLAKDNVSHIYYEAVEQTGHAGGWPHWDAILWPTIHCVRVTPMKQTIQEYIDEIHGPRGEILMETHDTPQYYCQDYRNKLNPTVLDKMVGTGANLLQLDKRSWKVHGLALRDAIDFLIPLEYSESHNSRSCALDD